MQLAYRLRVGSVNDFNADIITLAGLGTMHKTAQHCVFLAEQPLQATGSCIWNGGSATVQGWLNMKVSGDTAMTEAPAITLQRYARTLGIAMPLAGAMTAASMNSLRHCVQGDDNTVVACFVTAGIRNARRVGDTADEQLQPGTINIALVCNQRFTPAAAIEALLIATEAKTAACYDLNIKSPVSNRMATGTGTDSICLLSTLESARQTSVEYCGKHTRIGEWIGRASHDAVHRSLAGCLTTPS